MFHSNSLSVWCKPDTIVRESTSVSKELIAPWNEKILLTFLSNYKLEDTYNADELVYSTIVCLIKRNTSPVRNALVVKTVKFG